MKPDDLSGIVKHAQCAVDPIREKLFTHMKMKLPLDQTGREMWLGGLGDLDPMRPPPPLIAR